MRLLVLGGTVFLGRHVVAAALDRGDKVTILTRGLHGGPPEGVEHLRGDRGTELTSLVEGRSWDAVVDTSGYEAGVVARGARALAGRVGHYVFVSSCSVYPGWPAEAVDEMSPVWQEGDGYGEQKAACERALGAILPGRVASLRAGLICGPHDNVFRLPWWLQRLAGGGDVLAPGDPARTVQLIDARDIASWALDLAAGGVPGTFNTTAPPGRPAWGEVLETAAELTSAGARLRWVPDDRLLAAGVEPWNDLPLWTPDAEGFRGTWSAATDRAQAAGLVCRPVEATLADTWTWLQDGGAAELGDWRAEVRPRGIPRDLERRLLAE
jgi:2'-hydroxyisoflavone reductase